MLSWVVCNDKCSIILFNNQLSSTWYLKPTDTGLVKIFHSLAQLNYKSSVVPGCIYHIYRSYSTWQDFHDSFGKAKNILNNNRCPSSFYEPFICKALEKCREKAESQDDQENEQEVPEHMIRLRFRREVSDNYSRVLRNLKAPCASLLIREIKLSINTRDIHRRCELTMRLWAYAMVLLFPYL